MAEPDTSPSEVSKDSLVTLLAALRSDDAFIRLLTGAAHTNSTLAPGSLASDILRGAEEIAAFLYGDEKYRRKVYNLIESGSLPHFRLGAGLCARKSVLLEWIAKQEGGTASCEA